MSNSQKGCVTVLVVDDDEAVRNLIQEFLKGCPYRVLAASGGCEALSIVRASPGEINLLLCDIEMPCLDGISLSLEVLAEQPETRVLLVSGGTARPPKARLPFLGKPFSREQLIAKVQQVLSNSSWKSAE